jgi:beta-propeller repeat-containing protein
MPITRPRTTVVWRLSLLAVLGVGGAAEAGSPSSEPSSGRARLDESHGKRSLYFEPNRGQTDARVKFVGRGTDHKLYLTAHELVLASPTDVLRVKLVGAQASAVAEGVDPLPGKSSYFLGNDPARWQSNVPHYAKVKFRDVYDGIDLIYYERGEHLEYDFVVNPGANPEAIRIQVQGTEGMHLTADGNLVLRTRGGEHVMRKPVLYQESEQGRREIAGGYRLSADAKDVVAVDVADYDTRRPLVIDPVLVYSTFLGGLGGEGGTGIAVDAAGHAYVTGITGSLDFPTADPLQPAKSGTFDLFVTKLGLDGSTLVYSTYLGGTGSFDVGYAIAADAQGCAYVAGVTNSSNFPTVSPIQANKRGLYDGFVTKISVDGSAIVYSTYVGGSSTDNILDIEVDSLGHAHVGGETLSTDYPTVNPIQSSFGGGYDDGVVGKINPSGNAWVYLTYLGGSGNDEVRGIAADASGNTYATGDTRSDDFPTKNPLQAARGGYADAFVTKFSGAGELVYSTYLGGNASEETIGGLKLIAVDRENSVYITGATISPDFPVVNPIQATRSAGLDAYISKIDVSGSVLVYSTYLGGGTGGTGSGADHGYAIVVDVHGHAYVSGQTETEDFPTVNAIQPVYGGGSGEGWVAMLSVDGSALVYSTYLGGISEDRADGLALGPDGSVYVTGQTFSSNFPTQQAVQPTFGGAQDAFVTKIGSVIPPGEVRGLSVSSNAAVQWEAVPGAATYHVYRGEDVDLPRLLDTETDSCLRFSTAELSTGVLTEEPLPGSFHWYLVRAENANGLGPVGSATAGPRILDSSGDCP